MTSGVNSPTKQVTDALNVSRETFAQLQAFVALVEKWQPRINLIANSTISSIWTRHILDSAQLVSHLPENTNRILDVGSGGGFPGIVLSIITRAEVHLVESDQRKSVFLKTVIRELGLTAIVHNQRVEALENLNADVITARALASVETLISLLETQLMRRSDKQPEKLPLCLFLKGARLHQELTILDSYPTMSATSYPSITSDDGAVLALKING